MIARLLSFRHDEVISNDLDWKDCDFSSINDLVFSVHRKIETQCCQQ